MRKIVMGICVILTLLLAGCINIEYYYETETPEPTITETPTPTTPVPTTATPTTVPPTTTVPTTPPSVEGLQIEVWLSKSDGSDYLIGEDCPLYFKLSKDCFVSLEVITSSGTRTSFSNEFYSAGEHTLEGYVAEPIGRHTLKLYGVADNEKVSDSCYFYVERPTTFDVRGLSVAFSNKWKVGETHVAEVTVKNIGVSGNGDVILWVDSRKIVKNIYISKNATKTIEIEFVIERTGTITIKAGKISTTIEIKT